MINNLLTMQHREQMYAYKYNPRTDAPHHLHVFSNNCSKSNFVLIFLSFLAFRSYRQKARILIAKHKAFVKTWCKVSKYAISMSNAYNAHRLEDRVCAGTLGGSQSHWNTVHCKGAPRYRDIVVPPSPCRCRLRGRTPLTEQLEGAGMSAILSPHFHWRIRGLVPALITRPRNPLLRYRRRTPNALPSPK